MGGMACKLTYWCTLTTFRTDWIWVIVCWFSSFWRYFYLVKHVKMLVSGIFYWTHERNGMWFYMLMYSDHLQNWLGFYHVCWFFSFWRHFDLAKQSNLRVPGIFRGTHRKNDVKFGVMMHPDHLWKWLRIWSCLLVFLIFVMSAVWLHASRSGLWRLKGATAIRSLYILVTFVAIISTVSYRS